MPFPQYLIATRGHSVDKTTGLLSLFEVVEKIVSFPTPEPEGGGVVIVEHHPIGIHACWAIDAEAGETADDVFDVRLRLRMEGDANPLAEHTAHFSFQVPGLTSFRQTFNIGSPLPAPRSGSLLVEVSVRKVGTDDWVDQVYRIAVEKQTKPVLAGEYMSGGPPPASPPTA